MQFKTKQEKQNQNSMLIKKREERKSNNFENFAKREESGNF